MPVRKNVSDTGTNTTSLLPEHWQVLYSIHDLTDAQRSKIFRNVTTPFNSFEFLSALEDSGSIGKHTGWLPEYLLFENKGQCGLLLGYKKTNSYGEYVFDWAWADAYHRNGIEYYPKYTIAIPYSPIPCSKWIGNSSLSIDSALDVANHYANQKGYSGCHLLFLEDQADKTLPAANQSFIRRVGNQFHWFNNRTIATTDSLAGALDTKPESYFQDFDDFLSVLTARKRKMIKKERNKVSQLFNFYWKQGNEITDEEIEAFYLSYQSTYLKRGRAGYLNKTFFKQIFSTMANKVRLLLCNYEDKVVASALYFVDGETLYGRYWGALGEFEQLHFEACYYQGIEFCIEHKLKRFNPGTQGEHKIARGFKPIETNSLHTLALEPFHNAVEQFCIEEALHNSNYMQACDERLPYKKADN